MESTRNQISGILAHLRDLAEGTERERADIQQEIERKVQSAPL